jgi:hypothetical protein
VERAKQIVAYYLTPVSSPYEPSRAAVERMVDQAFTAIAASGLRVYDSATARKRVAGYLSTYLDADPVCDTDELLAALEAE